jgi:hypothetical protein
MYSRHSLFYVLFFLIIYSVKVVAAGPALRPWAENHSYWSCQDNPVLLLGGSNDDNLFQWPRKELLAQLDRLANVGGNVIRNTMSDRKDKGFEVYPFKQQKNGTYDLSQWNKEYWKRFERLLRETAKRGIVVQIEIWDRFDYTDSDGSGRWQTHPYNPKNNVNYTYEQSGFAERYPDHPSANKQLLFFTTPKQRNNRVVLKYQQRYVDKMLDHSLQYEHVLYCMDNETQADEEWSRYWAEYVKRRARKEGRLVFLTEMWGDQALTAEQHRRTFDHPELYDFVEVSQNNHNRGQKHWDNFLYVKKYLSNNPRPINTTKTYGADGSRYGTDQDGVERFWRHLLAGAASIRFHRPEAGLGLNEKAAASIRAARKLESIIPLWSVEPANELLSDREKNEAYLAADPGRSYVVYFPTGGEVKVDMSIAKESFIAHWIDIDSGEMGPTQNFSGGDKISVAAPGRKNWVVAIIVRK